MLQTILKYAGAAYLIYLAAMIAMSGAATPEQDNRRGPMTFWGAVLFQWINVKGWVMVIGTITAYAAIAAFPWNIVIQTVITFVVGIPATVAWALFGSVAAAVPDLAADGTRLQYRDGVVAAGLALSGVHGRMMPRPRHAREGFPLREKML